MGKAFESNVLSGLDQEGAKLEERLFEAEEKLAFVAGWFAGFEPDISIIEYRAEVPGRYSGPPEDCFPGEPEEIEYDVVMSPKNMPSPEEMADMILEVLGEDFFTNDALQQAREARHDV
jgi:hypothetical protein